MSVSARVSAAVPSVREGCPGSSRLQRPSASSRQSWLWRGALSPTGWSSREARLLPIPLGVCRAAVTEDAESQEQASESWPQDGATAAGEAQLFAKPEDLQLEPGELSYIDRKGQGLACDQFTCVGCTRPECQTGSGCMQNLWRYEPGGYLKAILSARVYDVAIQSPLEKAEKLSEATGNTILLKREDLQPVKSFKLRGAYNKMAQLSPDELARGVICSSAGNHAQGVALAGKALGCSAIICMPTNTPNIKVDAVRRLGGQVELVGESYNETQAYAMERAEADGRIFVAPYDDPYTIAGQGTIAAEIVQQISHLDDLDAVFVAIGGGGLIAGIAAFLKELKPSIKVIGVEPAGANAMAQSLAAGRRVNLSKVDSFADGVAVKQVGMETFRLCQDLVDGVVLVDNSAVSAAIKDVFNETRSILEPAGAVALAGAKAWMKRNGVKDNTVVAVTSGANINFDRLRLVSELADVGAKTEVMLASTIPEQPGSFIEFVKIVSGTDASVDFTEFKYRFCATSAAHILYSVSMSREFDLLELTSRLEENNMATTDCSNIGAALVHLRHMVGGRPRSFTGQLPDEKIFIVAFPERPGALLRFLEVFDGFNISMFHYRKSGNRATELLLGMQVPPERESEFSCEADSLASAGYDFQPLDASAQQVFDMFLQ